jgi:hypothetical protein
MYGFQNFIPLTTEEILKRISQSDIFKIIFKEHPVLGKYYISPFRNDDNAGCFFEYYNSKLFFVDFADEITHRDCFGVICDYFNINYIQSLEYINSYYKLGLNYSNDDTKPVIYEPVNYTNNVKKTKTEFIFKPRNFNNSDIEYWEQYGITIKQLKEDGVYPIIWFKIIKDVKITTIRPIVNSYVYTGFENNKIKIYTPLTNNKKFKWFTNCTQDDVGNIDNLPISGKKLIITKSYKDWRVLTNYNINGVWLQNEGGIPNMSILSNLSNRFEEIIIFFDNDITGKKQSEKLKLIINSNFPKKARIVFLEGLLKDPSDYYANNGRLELLFQLIKYKLL